MPKLIAAINMTLDGYCDHTSGIADEETHAHYNALMQQCGTLLYGRVTYQLMESFWPNIVAAPTGEPAFDAFAQLIDDMPKVVFSRTLTEVTWHNTTLKHTLVPEEILALKASADKDLAAGSPSMIVQLLQLGLVDELQLCIHPVIAGGGLALFKDIHARMDLQLLWSKPFRCGAVVHTYAPKAEGGV
jgi:dihydrofolate reductase